MTFQVSAGLLDACVLSIIHKEETYGYKITQEIKEKLGLSESTLYPVLRRLQKEELFTVYDQEVGGRNRRYYRITEKGKRRLQEYREDWIDFQKNISSILVEGEIHD